MRLALVLAASLLAGCTVEPPHVEGGSPAGSFAPSEAHPTAADALLPGGGPRSFEVPAWRIGESWRYALTDTQGGPGGTQHLVVVRDLGNDYLVASADQGAAVDAAFEGRTTFGRISKATLSGYDRGTNTRFLDFPLTDNKTWTLQARLFGPMPVQARYDPNADGRGPGYRIEGQAGTNLVRLTYAEQVRWMTSFQLSDAEGPRFTRSLQAYNANYTGPWFLASAEDLYVTSRNGTVAALPTETFDQGRDYAQLRLRVRTQGQGLLDLRLLDPANQLRFNLTATGPMDQTFDLPAASGTWRVVWGLAGPLAVDVRVAGMLVEQGEVG